MLKLDDDPITLAFEAVVKRLKSDKRLGVIKKWKAVPYRPIDLKASDLPYCVISLKAGDTAIGSPNSQAETLQIGLDYFVDASGQNEDTAWKDITNLYGVFRSVLGPSNDTKWLLDAISKAKVRARMDGPIKIVKAGYTSIPLDGFNAAGASTVIHIPIDIKTC